MPWSLGTVVTLGFYGSACIASGVERGLSWLRNISQGQFVRMNDENCSSTGNNIKEPCDFVWSSVIERIQLHESIDAMKAKSQGKDILPQNSRLSRWTDTILDVILTRVKVMCCEISGLWMFGRRFMKIVCDHWIVSNWIRFDRLLHGDRVDKENKHEQLYHRYHEREATLARRRSMLWRS
jgi:hypothetical protein